MRTTAILLLTFITSAIQATTEIRFNPSVIIDHRVFVDIEIRSTSDDFILASQNLRAYFNSEGMSFLADATIPRLDASKYGEVNIVSHYEKINANEVDQLAFDDNLGFINISIELEDLIYGGITISDQWTAVATLVFEVDDTAVSHELLWAREGYGDAYASASVEISEWSTSGHIVSKRINKYHDLHRLDMDAEPSSRVDQNITVGPNPAQDYILISQNTDQAHVIIVDMVGRVVVEQRVTEPKTRINIKALPSGNYLIYLSIRNETLAKQIAKID